MRIGTHTSLLAPAILAAAAFTAQPALAANRANVPFDFVAAGQLCPAGAYTVERGKTGMSIQLHGAAHTFTWAAGPGNPSPSNQQVILLFDRAGNTPVLRSIQYHAIVTNRLDRNLKEAIPAPPQALAGQ